MNKQDPPSPQPVDTGEVKSCERTQTEIRLGDIEGDRQLKESLYRRIMAIAPWAEHCSVFAYCVRDVARKNGGDYETALFKVIEAVMEASGATRGPEASEADSVSQPPNALDAGRVSTPEVCSHGVSDKPEEDALGEKKP